MTRTVNLRYHFRKEGQRIITITPAWAGKGIAIHKPIWWDEHGHPQFDDAVGLWRLTHINSGLSMGSCRGSLDRVKRFAKEWDAEFAALKDGQAMAPKRIRAWRAAMREMEKSASRKPAMGSGQGVG